MRVKAFINKLKKLDQNAEVVTYDAEQGFYTAAIIQKDKNFTCYDSWISLENKPEPKKYILIY
jgi:hypothetical protein